MDMNFKINIRSWGPDPPTPRLEILAACKVSQYGWDLCLKITIDIRTVHGRCCGVGWLLYIKIIVYV